MNLISKDIKRTGNYWCSWRTQSTALENEELRKKGYNLRNRIDEEFLFGNIGVLTKYFEPIRGNKLTIDGKLITKTGLTAARDPIHETPGVIFKYIC